MNYFVLGLGITGISTIKTLSSIGYTVYAFDENLKDFSAVEDSLKEYNYNLIKNLNEINYDIIDTVVKSPGIKLENEILMNFKNLNKEIISDLELAYRLFPDKNLISITGTNGKTTTTMLLTHIINTSGRKAMAIGNIGVGMLWEIYNNKNIDYFVIEASSFQLASINSFRTKVAGIINISEDHIDWHGDYNKYIEDKSNIFKFQRDDDYLVVNCDDEIIKKIIRKTKSKVICTSQIKELKNGIYEKNEEIIYNNNGSEEYVLNTKDLKIVGKHNVQNTLIAVGMAICLEIDINTIREACITFNPVEHRIEFVREINGIKFYNDSKGTNIDATLKALNSFNSPIILIAGGYDKKVSFDELFKTGDYDLKSLIVFGETKYKIKNSAEKFGYSNIFVVENMEKAVELIEEIAENGDVALLSPACASWGMYKSYIERGKDFKRLVYKLGE
ncbi:UDP-N-acetylmuramoyl-L-alanine--D-glutamate ligase [Miniphocaeibacter halophilus]|uniref:UDP-N-acetylmuramoyl-L-alanine--D-glutamate ligase n=1 Tax=Miniphocaeibacter halophilus TaxID=2931922 RepID=A0AC61MPR2_9FIRM|nr:UDP-N-acetylmuramoyl-L-alanine--D-glutamate ligase [Miniphocaeibacter halophilus]QQK07509.1 UDP-N-acetylmuramoyl-L-alanine--D-glutamate ligase [Miniphocaeibacter halophilus]